MNLALLLSYNLWLFLHFRAHHVVWSYRQLFHMESHHFQLKLEWNVTQKGIIFDICLRSRWIPLGQQDVFGDEEFKFKRKVYGNDVQMHFWKFLQNYAIHTFGMMEYKHQPALGKFKPEFPRSNEAMIDSVIQMVEQFTPRSDLVKLVTHITSGHIAQLVLDLTHSYWANKNWNSHNNAVCAVMCNIAILVSALNGQAGLPVNFIQTLPKGVPLGGQKHGWHDIIMLNTWQAR